MNRNGGILCGEIAGTATQGARVQNGEAFEGLTKSLDDVEDRGKTFSKDDYENAITYLKDQKNYTSLFGDGSKTLMGVKQMTKPQAFKSMEKKYMDVQNFEENTGAGIENKIGAQTLYNFLETQCPFYHRLNVLFQDKANFTALFEFNHSKPGDC
ncbi:hypothetical protein VP01_1938g2 [Puccinia sorghi]|uniref:Uncharacterized protein n=1 Tax=Puccinia sorghi TaxID=27349 RepID=A0A0L6VCD6_9BASI|nr:hypothetical protein VP01_1938g2 [Puccinia sorghi]